MVIRRFLCNGYKLNKEGEKVIDVIIKIEDINSEEGQKLIEELSDELNSITGSTGKASFNNDDMLNDRSVFAVARDNDGNALGCGVLRYYSEDTVEIKRMYVRKKSLGVGSKLLSFLECKAKELNYRRIILETRVINNRAVRFYRKNEYRRLKNFGKYDGRDEAICFEKLINK